jgi:hypothetical protein
MLQDLRDRCNTVEECYEFMLAYAAQGLSADAGTAKGGELRNLLGRAVEAVSGLPAAYESAISQEALQPADKHRAFLKVLEQDSLHALAAMELVLLQQAISSQLVDNLNASIHLRSLLTDLFLVDEVAKVSQSTADQTPSSDSHEPQ